MEPRCPVADPAATLAALLRVWEPDPDVLAVAVVGSGAVGEGLDRWSDLDVVLVVEDVAHPRYHASDAWLRPLGEVYASERSSGPAHAALRVCFRDLRRLDLLVVRRSALATFAGGPGPLQGGARVVLDRTGRLAAALRLVPPARPPDPAEAEAAFRRLQEDFRWAAVVAATRIGRGDLLIGAHLALEMARHCLVLGMLLRDRAEGTRHHRCGGEMPAAALALPLPPTLSAEGVLDLMRASIRAWSDLAGVWEPGQVFEAGPLLALCSAASPA